MRRALLLVVAIAALVSPAAAVAGTVSVRGVDASAYPTVRLSVVTSSPAAKRPRVTENGVAVAGLQERTLASEKSVCLAVDRSRSMAGAALADATAAAASFVASKPEHDRLGIVSFGSTATSLTQFTAATIDAAGALRGLAVDAKSGTALYDAVVLCAHRLDAEQQPGKVVIVLTDGRDVSSDSTVQGAVAAAKSAGAAVYAIGIKGQGFTSAPLEQLAGATGGSYYAASSTSSLTSVYHAIAKELSRTWRVEYYTAAVPGDVLHVKASVPGFGSADSRYRVPGSSPGSGPAPNPVLPAEAYRSNVGTVVVMAAVGALVLLAMFLFLAMKKASWLKTRLDPHVGKARRAKRTSVREQMALASTLFKATEQAFGNFRQWAAVQRVLERADLPLRTVELFYICVGSGLAFGFAAAVTAKSALVIVVMLVVGGFLPLGFVMFKARRRLRAFENQLPDLLITMAASLKAGHSFRTGIQSVVDEGQDPASKEFKRVLTDTSLGRPMDDALAEMSNRIGSKNFEFVIQAVTIQRQVGGSLAGLFDMVADTVRNRQQFARKVRSLTAMGRMSAYVLVGLPFFMALALTLLNSDYMAPLYHEPTGHALIGLALTMIVVGALILRKIVAFKG